MEEKIATFQKLYPGRVLYVYKSGRISPLWTPGVEISQIVEPLIPDNLKIKPGWYLLNDFSYVKEPLRKEDVKAVVAYFVGNRPRCVDIHLKRGAYCSQNFLIGANSLDDGRSNTLKILEAGWIYGATTSAAKICIEQGGFLPSKNEVCLLHSQRDCIKAAQKINPNFTLYGEMMSSTENSADEHWVKFNGDWFLEEKANFQNFFCMY